MNTLSYAQYENLFFSYILSQNKSPKGTIILLDGLPSNPISKNKLMQELSNNYDVFFPRYEGTWESKGTFLERAPSESIIEFIQALRKSLKLENKRYLPKKIFLLGASFGGGVALDIATKCKVDKICAVSPVISFKRINGIETLEDYLRKEQKYNFNSNDWKRLLDDKIWNLNESRISNNSDIWIIIGKNDNQISEKEVVEFCKRKNIQNQILDLGHITLSKIPESTLVEIINFF